MPTDTIKWIEIYYIVLDTINCQEINYWVYRGFYSIPLIALINRQTDRPRNKLILVGLGTQKKLVPPGQSWLGWVTRRNWFIQVNPGWAG